MKLFFTLAFTFSFNALASPNSIIAIVNDTVITLDSISVQIKKTKTKAQKIALVEQQINLVLQAEKVQSLGIKPRPETIKAMLADVAKQNSITLAQLQSNNQFAEIVDNISQQLSLKGLEQFVLQRANITITQAEIDNYLAKNPNKNTQLVEQIKIAQIVISAVEKTDSLPQSKDDSIKQFLTGLSKEIKNGTTFSSLAKLHSQDFSYENGGETDWLVQEKLPTVFQQQLKNLNTDEVSKPFKTAKDWRIIKIIAQRKVDINLITVRAQLIQSKQHIFFQDWLKTLRKKAYIEIFEHKL
ncbi:Survival protein SurA precursor (Peptidyl-prolyl cis-trans isomerase SurA) [Bathymodiolus heckerae thiotrophic gill symbiont]|uniref:peptidylprolyl isomerase n=1 Tax=Bathymodiolus heckerae thiotrophic gill symbiont TaxID=1052212 RepID=UPI0010B7EE64|nr:peptidylprolyl isomerase [Bathymodiolus heckerae thiotrophic gill symbiont]SMN12854.1 Survival protein SurA precursor (Peptidyl-prolyl cis-trans isomerase SurA) [Bathymodiolus heckerae thiotrophic gill symbiont]SMN14553.1 Survival protein SurA precursor (Peptidyl-prolyl cis-trans isomerase SurA) [uncultured Candidatus Thioglobus sp.]